VITPHNGFFSDRGWWDVRFQAAQTARQFLEHQGASQRDNGITDRVAAGSWSPTP
jgi:hypothetical protein